MGNVGTTTTFPAELCTMGIPKDPWDFLARATEVGRPRSLAIHLNEEVTTMLQLIFRWLALAGKRTCSISDEVDKQMQRAGSPRKAVA